MYRRAHIERLKLVADLQSRGLRLRAVRDLLRKSELDSAAVTEWLGLDKQIRDWSEDEPRLMGPDELKEFLGDRPAGVIARLIRLRTIEPQGEGLQTRFLVKSPALTAIALKLEDAGIDLETAVNMYDILQGRLAKAADEVVAFAADHVGDGFGKSANAEDLKTAVNALFADNSCTEAVRVIFAREVDRALGALLKRGFPPKRMVGRARRRAGR
jgi:DNA-binding transcriptional MerR regulator